MSLTIATTRVEEMQRALRAATRALDRWKILERELEDVHIALEMAAEGIYNATLYDPEGTREDDA